jgi:hypothetical protein
MGMETVSNVGVTQRMPSYSNISPFPLDSPCLQHGQATADMFSFNAVPDIFFLLLLFLSLVILVPSGQ